MMKREGKKILKYILTYILCLKVKDKLKSF